ncbi:MAG: hypothetical protein LBP22_09010 [Deltaproteobacteria bacterium]|nr:hypothetical protein [Deltaproteobacteria bacterium]
MKSLAEAEIRGKADWPTLELCAFSVQEQKSCGTFSAQEKKSGAGTQNVPYYLHNITHQANP